MSRTILILAALIAAATATADELDARFAAAVALARHGERTAAIDAFEKLSHDYPLRPEPLNDLATLYAAAGDLPRARDALERALRTQPAYAAAHDNLRTVYAALASDAYRKALPLPGTPDTNPKLVLLETLDHPAPAVVASAPVTAPVVKTAAADAAFAVRAPANAPAPADATAPASAPASHAAAPATVAAVPVPIAKSSVTHAPVLDPIDARAFAAFAMVEAWRRAWVGRDVAGYTTAYAPQFVPPDGLQRAAWEAERAARIRAPKRIAIAISGRHLIMERDGAHARLSFVQHYRSDRFNGDSLKTMTLVHDGQRWLIAAERTGR